MHRSFKNNFLGLNYANRTITLADSGEGKFSTSTMANTALALNRSLLSPDLTANQVVYISDFATSQSELVATIEKVSGKSWTRDTIDSATAIKEYQQRIAKADYSVVGKLISLGFVTGRFGGWFEENEKLWNDEFGLPKASIEDVVRDAVEKMG